MQQLQEDARVKGLPVPVATQALYMEALVGYNLQVQQDIRVDTERNFLAIMLEVDKSHIPLPDEPPIHFMTRLPASQRVKAWQILSDRRKELYSNSDFFSSPQARKEADDLSKLLDKSIDMKQLIEASPMTLKEALGVIVEKVKIDFGKELPILIDTEAFKEENPDAFTDANVLYETKVSFPPFPTRMALTTAIRFVLSKIETKNATYLIRRNFVEVTTVTRQTSEKTLRVYPVGDLVIPINASTNPFAAAAAGAGGGLPGGAGAAGNRGIQGGIQGGFGQLGGGIQGGFGQLGGGGFGQLGGGFGQLGGGGFGQLGGGFGQLGGGGFGQLGGGGFGQLGGGFGQLGGGGFGQLGGGGFGQLGGGGFGQLGGGGFGQLGGGGFGQLGGGGFGQLGGGGLALQAASVLAAYPAPRFPARTALASISSTAAWGRSAPAGLTRD